jgi:hypothetical protein
MKKRVAVVIAFSFMLFAGCYHAVIKTGLNPGAKVILKSLRPSFIYGLVPPPPANVGGECSTGVALVETKHTFIDGLLSVVTGGIFTPMTYRITCATGSAITPDTILLHVARGDSVALARAAALSAEEGRAVYVRF